MINCKGNVVGILKVLSSSANEDDDDLEEVEGR